MRFKSVLILTALLLSFGLLATTVNAEKGDNQGENHSRQGSESSDVSTSTSGFRNFLFGQSTPRPSQSPESSTSGTFFNFMFKKPEGSPEGFHSPEPSETPESSTSGNLKVLGRLEGGRLISCEARQEAVNKRITSLSDLVVNIVAKFDAIALKVENYYTTILLPSGKVVPNYDALITDISSKKNAVQTALTSAQGSTTTFSCTSDDPKGFLTGFRTNMQGVKKALEEYRKSIRNLIVAVRGVVGEEGSPLPSASASASVSPSPVESPSPVVSPTP